MRQKKNRKKKKNRKIRILTGVVLGVGLAGALFFNVFKIRNIQVAGNTRYTKDEINDMYQKLLDAYNGLVILNDKSFYELRGVYVCKL